MTRKEKTRILIGIIINLVVFGLTVFCLCQFINYLIKGSSDNRFRYYTNISNLTVGFISLINAILLIVSLLKGKIIIPCYFSIIKFVGQCMTLLTFLTVLVALAPLAGFKEMYKDAKFITHLVVPVLAFVSYLFLEEKNHFKFKYSLFGFLPPIIYSIIYSVSVFALKIWPDIYKINTFGTWYIVMIGVDLFGFGISIGLYYLKTYVDIF